MGGWGRRESFGGGGKGDGGVVILLQINNFFLS